MTGKGVRFDRKVATKGGRDDSFVRHRSIRTCHRGKEGGREKGREGALVCNGAKNYAEMVAMVALNGPDCFECRYPFFGNAGFPTRLTFSLSVL